jgi:hypothetical protein
MIIPKKEYEKPESGLHHAVLADIVELGNVTTVYQGQSKTFPAARFVWFLNVLGKDGKPLQVAKRYNVSNFHEKSNVYKDLKEILGQPPNPAADIDNYIGVTRKLWINREKSEDGTKDFANIKGYLPADPGVVVPIPAGFVRAKFQPKTQTGPTGAPVQTYATPQAAQQAAQYVPPGAQPVQQGSDVKF